MYIQCVYNEYTLDTRAGHDDMSYEVEYLRRTIREAAQRTIAAAAVNVHPDTPEHREEQLKAIVDTLTPHDWLELLKQ